MDKHKKLKTLVLPLSAVEWFSFISFDKVERFRNLVFIYYTDLSKKATEGNLGEGRAKDFIKIAKNLREELSKVGINVFIKKVGKDFVSCGYDKAEAIF